MDRLAAVIALTLGIAGALTTSTTADAEDDPTPPNVVVIMVDDMPAHTMWVLDDTLQLLAGEGTTYSNAVAEYALCCPSRTTLLTGQYSHNHGITDNQGGWQQFKSSPRYTDHLGTWLQAAGYETALVGKMLNGYNSELVPPGWDRWAVLVGSSAYNYLNYDINVDGAIEQQRANNGGTYQTDRLAELAVQRVDQLVDGGGPFFMWVTPLAPHTQSGKRYAIPSAAHAHTHDGAAWRPEALADPDRMARPAPQRRSRPSTAEQATIDDAYESILEALESVDELVVDVVAALEANDVLDDTIVIFTSDHGYMLGELGIQQGKIHPYEPALRTPLIARGPGIAAGAIEDRLVVNADLTATIVDAAGATPSYQLDGIALDELVDNRAVPVHGITGSTHYIGVRAEDEVWWTIDNAHRTAELYDLAIDPEQLHNLTTGRDRWRLDPARQALLEDLWSCAGGDCQRTWSTVPLR